MSWTALLLRARAPRCRTTCASPDQATADRDATTAPSRRCQLRQRRAAAPPPTGRWRVKRMRPSAHTWRHLQASATPSRRTRSPCLHLRLLFWFSWYLFAAKSVPRLPQENQIEDVLLETFSGRIRRVCGQLSSKTKSYILGLIRFGGPFWDPQRISGGRGRRLAIPLGRVPRFPDGQFERNF